MKLIDKDALVAEIEKKIKQYEKAFDSPSFASYEASLIAKGKYRKLLDILQFIDTLDVKEVDLEKEIETHLKDCLDVKFPTTDIELIKKDVTYTAKKFFELGMAASNKSQKGEEI